MPLGASRLTLLAFQASVATSATVIRRKVGLEAKEQVHVDVSPFVYGGSASFDGGTDDYILVDHTAQNIDYADDFTVEMWARWTSLPGSNLFSMLATTSTRGDYLSLYNKAGTYTMHAALSDGSTVYYPIFNTPVTPVTNTWYHLAFVKNGATFKMYWDGTECTSDNGSAGTMSASLGMDGIQRIGDWSGGTSYAMNGNIDEFRCSKTARYTLDFVPLGPFANDDNTQLLVHMDGTENSTTFVDDNGASTAGYYDPYASNLKLAVPFDDVNGVNDVAHNITGTGLSGAATVTQGTCSVITGGSNLWPWYNSTLYNNSTGDSGLTYALPSSFGNAASDTYAVSLWVRATNSGTNQNWALSSADSGGRWLFGFNTGSNLSFGSENNIGLGDSEWHHIAIVNDGGTRNFYIDGIYRATSQSTPVNGRWYSGNTGFSTLHVGQFTSASVNEFNGNLQDLKVYIGTTAGFTGTDTGAKNFMLPGSIKKLYPGMPSVTAHSNAKIQTSDSKFGGGSVTFDGSDDNLRVFPQWDVTQPWTLEFFFKTGSTGNQNMFGMTQSDASTESNCIFIRTNGGKVQVYTSTVGGGSWNGAVGVYTGSYSTTDWNHYALQWDGTNLKQFLNGSESSSTSHASPVVDNKYYENWFGGAFGSTAWFSGAFDEIRISSTARYSGSYTVPTAALVPDTNTKFLLHCDGTNNSTDFIPDAGVTRSAIGLEAENNTHISTGQNQFGVSSAEFDGTTDILVTNGPNLGSSQWTIEMWARFDSVSGVRVLYDDRESANSSTGTSLLYTSGTTLFWNSQQVNKITGSVTLAIDTWYHIAVSKDGSNNVRLFVDGSETGSSYTDANTFAQPDGEGYFGANHQTAGAHCLDGYIDEIRFSNTCRYSGNFTPSTTQFQNDANTLLLIHADGSNNSTTFIDDNGKEA